MHGCHPRASRSSDEWNGSVVSIATAVAGQTMTHLQGEKALPLVNSWLSYRSQMKQLHLFDRTRAARSGPTTHGGELIAGKRKMARPFSRRRPCHFVLRSSRARGAWSLRRPAHQAAIENLLSRLSVAHGVRIYERAIVGNHIHLLLRARDRLGLASFLRAFAGLAACAVTGARRGAPRGKFWDYTCFSRLLSWGRVFRWCAGLRSTQRARSGGSRPSAPASSCDARTGLAARRSAGSQPISSVRPTRLGRPAPHELAPTAPKRKSTCDPFRARVESQTVAMAVPTRVSGRRAAARHTRRPDRLADRIRAVIPSKSRYRTTRVGLGVRALAAVPAVARAADFAESGAALRPAYPARPAMRSITKGTAAGLRFTMWNAPSTASTIALSRPCM